ncbi:hypothetical protein ACE1AT_07685 [Pelatocladus sp. BLCC-F211]|uniref:hypothetical protein n=1 Tax=Pelatocladus sp. BLCC-F211 TaxID=3342752 RepID=UPI0035B91ABD
MSDSFPFSNFEQQHQWYQDIDNANRNNIFCHCRACGYEWMDSKKEATCVKCGNKDVESISAWQFPDD